MPNLAKSSDMLLVFERTCRNVSVVGYLSCCSESIEDGVEVGYMRERREEVKEVEEEDGEDGAR